MAYLLYTGTRLVAAEVALIWVRLFVAAMGQQVEQRIAFQKLTSLGGLGDLGMGGAVAIRTGQYLGEGKEEELKKFLASARAAFLVLALIAGVTIFGLSPWLPHWLGYKEVPPIGTVDFATNDLINLSALVARLNPPSPTDVVSAYVSARLSPATREFLLQGNVRTNAALREMLTVDINRVSRNTNLYEPARFSGIKLSEKTQKMLNAADASPRDPVRLNRLLLMDAYPRELARNHASGPLPPLFAMGALLVVGVLLSSYLSNLNYGCGNVVWPVVPLFVLLQLTMLGQWLLARQEQPLWVQYIPAVLAAAAGLWLMRAYVRISHRALANLLPLALNWRMILVLFESSFWFYLCSLGNSIYRTTDSQVINAGFAPGTPGGLRI